MSFSGIKFLVTGGAGFVGSSIVKRLLSENANVIVLDDLFTGLQEILPLDHPNLEFVQGTVTDFQLVDELVKRSDIIIHEAARNITVSMTNPLEDFNVNIGGTLNVLEAVRKSGHKKIVYASSASVYGNPKYLPINEDDVQRTLSPYAVSKLAGENYCIAFYESYGMPTTVVRYSNIYGPFQMTSNPYCGVVSKFFNAVLNDQPPTIHGDGDQTRDFTFIDDAVDATLAIAMSDRSIGQIYNVASGMETTINELAHIIIEICGSDVKPVYIDKRDIDNIRRRVLNIEKIRREIRWTPKVTLKRGLIKTKEWFLEEFYKRKS
ncbi:MAG: NAD-dependent epimerase/dehydratase family protein [Candidatus Poribacteria bacterium]